MAPRPCPDDTTVAAFFDGVLAADARRDLLDHAADCSECRALLSDLSTSDGPDERQSLERYELLGAVGAGGMGIVYAAHDTELDRRVALKLVRHEDASEARRRALVREARAMARLAHPNVVRVFDVGHHDGRVFVTMEFVEGGTLRGFIESGPRSFREIARLFEGAGRGLAAAHRAGLVHRDFKPENVLLREGTALVTDFGLARFVDDGGLEGAAARTAPENGRLADSRSAIAGTLHYMAPEQLRGERVDARSDLFGYCVAFWEALFGARPFSGTTKEELLEAIGTGPPRKRPRVDAPEATVTALRRGLAFAPADRQASIDDFLEDALPTAASRRSKLVAPAILAGAAALGGSYLVFAGNSEPPAPRPVHAFTSAPPSSELPATSVVATPAPPATSVLLSARLEPPPPPKTIPLRTPSTPSSASEPARGPGGVFVTPPF